MAGSNSNIQNPKTGTKIDFKSFSIFLWRLQNTFSLIVLKGLCIFCPNPAKKTPIKGMPRTAYAIQNPRPRTVEGEM